ncbi:MAG: hypothetical protein QXZ02_00630 [Candidatus Bathyarchaeia archaeon]
MDRRNFTALENANVILSSAIPEGLMDGALILRLGRGLLKALK